MTQTTEPQLYHIDYASFLKRVGDLSEQVSQSEWKPDFVIGVGRGGLVPAVYLSHRLNLPMLSIDHSSKVPGFADELLAKVAGMSGDGTRMLFVDDINDSGGTILYIRELLAGAGCQADNLRFAVVITNTRSRASVDLWGEKIDRDEDKRWFVFPWEAVGTREAIIEEALSVPERLS